MNFIFRNCYSLKEIDLTNFKSLNVKHINSMFYNCKSLISLNITHFNTSSVKYFNHMFAGCSSLTSLDISNFHSKHIKNLQSMFEGCMNLSYINMSNFIEYNKTISIYSNIFNKINNNLIICIQKDKAPIITQLINEIEYATVDCRENPFDYNIYKNGANGNCSDEFPFIMLSTQQCVDNCQIELILKEECILYFHENRKSQDIIQKNIEMSFTSEEYNTSNLDNDKEEIIKK